ncbi:MAG: hypothetical protein Q9196_002754 [Gyalolechia fulgens]
MDVSNLYEELAMTLLIILASFNEKARMAERYVRFNVPELMRTAAMAVGRDRCVDIVKVTEGGFNKIFLLTMSDGYEVIARIPTPIAGSAHHTTASEVATMDFLRTRLDIPVPQVFAWASRVGGDNAVGAEYIVMEKMQGESLASRWLSLSTKELAEVIQKIVDIESRLFSTLEKPKLSENFEEMNPEEQRKAFLDLKHKQANLYYTAATGLKCQCHMRALRLPYLGMRQYLIKQAGMPWDGDLFNLRAALIGVHSKWDDLVGECACPVSFTHEEVRIAMQESREWNEAAEVLNTIRDALRIDGEGGTDPENYSRAEALNKEWRIQLPKEVEAGEKERCWQIWPFKDDNDDSKAPAAVEN